MRNASTESLICTYDITGNMEPNILVIVMDALRYDRVGALEGRKITPNIDEFAVDAVKFTSAFSTTNATDPAVTSLNTGRYPASQGLINHGTRVTKAEKRSVEQIPQIQEVLSAEGYRTAKFGRPLGRWHRKGFDIYPSSSEARVSMEQREQTGQTKPGERTGTKQQVATALERIHPSLRTAASVAYRNTINIKQHMGVTPTQDESDSSRSHDGVIENFREFVDGRSPFYAFIHFMDTHRYGRDFDPERIVEYLRTYDYDVDRAHEIREGNRFRQLIEDGEYPDIANKYYLPDGSPTTAVSNAHYDASVTHGDERVGEILDILRAAGIFEDTLIIFLADHGESLTEHGIYYDHHGLYDESVKIPLIVRPPGGADKKVDDFVQINDICPTIVAYTECSGLTPDGRSLRPAIERDESIERDFVMAEEAHTQRRRMIRSRESKLIRLVDGNPICRYCDIQHAEPIELYRLDVDSDEKNNVANSHPSTVEKLGKICDERISDYEYSKPANNTAKKISYDDEEEIHEHLRALGYR